MSDDLKADLAEALRYALKHKTFYIRKANLTEDHIRIDANCIAAQLLLSNFKIVKGEPGKPSGWPVEEKTPPN